MNISSLDPRTIITQGTSGPDGSLITTFLRSIFHDGTENHPAGTLVNKPWTREDQQRFDDETQGAADEFGGSLGHTVKRFGIVFHDAGEFTPKP